MITLFAVSGAVRPSLASIHPVYERACVLWRTQWTDGAAVCPPPPSASFLLAAAAWLASFHHRSTVVVTSRSQTVNIRLSIVIESAGQPMCTQGGGTRRDGLTGLAAE